jgi:hypothetical protein
MRVCNEDKQSYWLYNIFKPSGIYMYHLL